jgi:hypothetical protein
MNDITFATEVWTARDLCNGQTSITDESGLFVAQVITEDAPLIVEAPQMEAILLKLNRGEDLSPEMRQEISELLQRIEDAST